MENKGPGCLSEIDFPDYYRKLVKKIEWMIDTHAENLKKSCINHLQITNCMAMYFNDLECDFDNKKLTSDEAIDEMFIFACWYLSKFDPPNHWKESMDSLIKQSTFRNTKKVESSEEIGKLDSSV